MHVCLYVPEKIGDFLFYLFSFFGVDFVKKMGDWSFIGLVFQEKKR